MFLFSLADLGKIVGVYSTSIVNGTAVNTPPHPPKNIISILCLLYVTIDFKCCGLSLNI